MGGWGGGVSMFILHKITFNAIYIRFFPCHGFSENQNLEQYIKLGESNFHDFKVILKI